MKVAIGNITPLVGALALVAGLAAPAQTLSWKGHTWNVTNGGMAGVVPGSPSNLTIDANGYLHMKIVQSGSSWTAAEMFTAENLGFGTYQWQFEGAVDNFDKCVVLGLFPYGPAAGIGGDGENEIDIEFSKWNGTVGAHNADFTYYPATGYGNAALNPSDYDEFTVSLGGATLSTARTVWSSKSISGTIMTGQQPVGTTANVLHTHTYAPASNWTQTIPQVAVPLGMNFWCYGTTPASNQEIIVRDFQFIPEGSQPVNYTLTASAGSGGSISPSGSVSVAQGGNQTFTFTASAGYTISAVTVDGAGKGVLPSYVFSNVQAAHTISVAFTPSPANVSVTISPKTPSLATGATQQFTASISGTTNTAVTWTTDAGTVSAAGLYKAPATAGTYHVRARSVADNSKSDLATITVTSSATVAVTISPKTPTLAAGTTLQFTASVSGTPNTAVTWTTDAGTVSTSGLYKAPDAAGTYHVRARSVADTTQSDLATITVTSAQIVAVTIGPKTPTLAAGATQQFTASVTGTTNTAVTWTTDAGTVSTSGLYQAPAAAGIYHVRARSVFDTTKSDLATITVTASGSANIAPRGLAATVFNATGERGFALWEGAVCSDPITAMPENAQN